MAYAKSKDKSWAVEARILVDAYVQGQTENYGLTPQRILQVAKEAVDRQGFVLYSDYDPDLLVEILNGVRPSTIAWRLFTIKKTLEAHLWRYQGKSKFLPPEAMPEATDFQKGAEKPPQIRGAWKGVDFSDEEIDAVKSGWLKE